MDSSNKTLSNLCLYSNIDTERSWVGQNPTLRICTDLKLDKSSVEQQINEWKYLFINLFFIQL